MSALPCPGSGREAAEDVLTALVVSLAGLPEDRVRPRYQPNPPKAPKPEVNWCAVGLAKRAAPPVSEVRRVQGKDGHETARVMTHEVLEVLVSFYGPNADELALALREGLQVEANRTPLREANMAYVRGGDIVHAPEYVNTRWQYRTDLPLTFRRGPAHRNRLNKAEGDVTVPPVETVPLCCGRLTSR